MKTILFFKRIDIIAQLLSIVIPVVLCLLKQNGWYLLYIYYSLGLVQLISCIINRLFFDDFLRAESRSTLEVFVLMLVVVGAVIGYSNMGELLFHFLFFCSLAVLYWLSGIL